MAARGGKMGRFESCRARWWPGLPAPSVGHAPAHHRVGPEIPERVRGVHPERVLPDRQLPELSLPLARRECLLVDLTLEGDTALPCGEANGRLRRARLLLRALVNRDLRTRRVTRGAIGL